jgi:ubiquinone/menaquinone biosynthesis C-methylase UbiE
MKNTERFSDRVENYVLYRPHYPSTIIPFLNETFGFTSNHIVADIGSGTGISSEIFIENGNTVYAVEPNKEMRDAAEKLFAKNKRFISINGTAEVTGLNEASVDLIIAGQAFHWFDTAKTKQEFKRIAAANAHLVLMWNERKEHSPFQQAYEKMLLEFAPGYENVAHRNISLETITAFFSPEKCAVKSFYNAQSFDFPGLKGRLLSSSYAPLESHENYQPMMGRLQDIFDRYSHNGEIIFEYDCRLYFGKISGK